MTLTDFLLARIAEDEAVARSVVKANEGRSRTQDEPWGLSWQDDNDQMSIEPDRILCVEPARVLAECESKRRLIAEVHPGATAEDECGGCGATLGGEWLTPPGAVCPVLALLALPYADHPDYDPEWLP